MKRTITFLIMAWAYFTYAHAQNFIVYSVANTVKIADGKTLRPITQGQKLNIKSKVDFATKATLDLINVENQKRYILNANKGAYSIEKLINKSNGIELSMNYLRYLMKRLLERTAEKNGDGEEGGGSYRDGQEDMFDIQDWLEQDSIGNTGIPDVNQ